MIDPQYRIAAGVIQWPARPTADEYRTRIHAGRRVTPFLFESVSLDRDDC
jgi:hypothetical protein